MRKKKVVKVSFLDAENETFLFSLTQIETDI